MRASRTREDSREYSYSLDLSLGSFDWIAGEGCWASKKRRAHFLWNCERADGWPR